MLSNGVFDTCGAILNAACPAWKKLLATLGTVTPIGMRNWAHAGQS